jgi:hypothetical protein
MVKKATYDQPPSVFEIRNLAIPRILVRELLQRPMVLKGCICFDESDDLCSACRKYLKTSYVELDRIALKILEAERASYSDKRRVRVQRGRG